MTTTTESSGFRLIFDVDETTRLRPKDANLQLFTQAILWFNKLAVFRLWEMQFFCDSRPTSETLKDHQAILQKMMVEAEEITRRAHTSGEMFTSENGFTLQDLEAAIEELKATLIQWHGSLSETRKIQILSLLADEPKS